MIQVYCGDGKGKTTAAVGGAVRAAGAGRSVLFMQFMKGNPTSELEVLKQIPNIEIMRSPKHFGFYKEMTGEEKKELKEIHNQILEKAEAYLEKNKKELKKCFIVFDEVTYAYQWELLDRERLLKILGRMEGDAEAVITGREVPEEILSLAAYLSNIQCKKHPYEKGIGARKGIEW